MRAGSNQVSDSRLGGQVYLSSKLIPQDGFYRGGSLFRGSGFWGSDAAMPHARLKHGVFGHNATERVYIAGGIDRMGSYLSR